MRVQLIDDTETTTVLIKLVFLTELGDMEPSLQLK